jgi:hypothetical protein
MWRKLDLMENVFLNSQLLGRSLQYTRLWNRNGSGRELYLWLYGSLDQKHLQYDQVDQQDHINQERQNSQVHLPLQVYQLFPSLKNTSCGLIMKT